ncbi:hypothetical protein BC826DRAFT_1183344 [Russula brevipes]|nr:hypothetical protein BC826DRAFT_1183344 [Russula brevipes]
MHSLALAPLLRLFLLQVHQAATQPTLNPASLLADPYDMPNMGLLATRQCTPSILTTPPDHFEIPPKSDRLGSKTKNSSPLHAPTCGDNPHDAGSPHGPRKRHMEQHASVAQAEATRDIRAHTKALSVSGAMAHIAKEEVAHVDETSAIKRTGVCEASADAAKRVRDWDEERGPRRATQIHNKRKTCPAAQRSTRVERGRQHRRALAPPAKGCRAPHEPRCCHPISVSLM